MKQSIEKYFTQKYNSVQNTFVPVSTFSSETSSKFFHSFFNKFCTSGCSIKTSSIFNSALYYLKRNYGNEVLLYPTDIHSCRKKIAFCWICLFLNLHQYTKSLCSKSLLSENIVELRDKCYSYLKNISFFYW